MSINFYDFKLLRVSSAPHPFPSFFFPPSVNFQTDTSFPFSRVLGGFIFLYFGINKASQVQMQANLLLPFGGLLESAYYTLVTFMLPLLKSFIFQKEKNHDFRKATKSYSSCGEYYHVLKDVGHCGKKPGATIYNDQQCSKANKNIFAHHSLA